MNKQLSREEYDIKEAAICADYPQLSHRYACASQNAEDSMIDCEGLSAQEAFEDYSQDRLDYFAMSLEGFAEEA